MDILILGLELRSVINGGLRGCVSRTGLEEDDILLWSLLTRLVVYNRRDRVVLFL